MPARKNIALLFPVILLVVLLVVILGWQWPGYSDRTSGELDEFGEEFLINDDFSTADQGYPDIAVDGMGDFWIVWQDNRDGDYSVYAQKFAWDGERLGPNTPVNDDTNSDEQFDPHVGVSVGGYTKFVWQDYRAAGHPTNPDIYAQDINEDGSADDPNLKVNSDFGQAGQRKPNLDVSPSGAAVVVWEDYRNNNRDIYAQWYDNTGAKIGGNIKINDDKDDVQHRPFTAADGAGNVLICWYDNRNGSDDVFGQIYDSGRNKVGSNFLINDVTAVSVQKFPAAAGLPGGGFVVVWTDYRNGPYPNDPDVYAQKLTAAGQKVGSNFRVNDDGPNVKQTEPQVGSAPTGGFVICWRDERGGAADIYAQRYEPSGDAAGSNIMVNDEDGDVLQSSPAVAISDAKMYFTWTDNRNSGLFDIYGRIITYDNPTISLVPSFVFFAAEDGQPNPPAQEITVNNAGAGVLEWAATDDAGWLSFSPNFGTAPTTVELQVDITGLSVGDYSATITFKDQNDPEIAGLLTVNLSIAYGAPIISVNPASLHFEAGIVGPAPEPQQLVITNVGGKTLNWQSNVPDQWISIVPVSGTAPSTTLVYIDIATLDVGTHEGTIPILDPTVYNPQVDVAVTCEVIDNSPVFEISDTELYFLAFEQQGDPPPRQVLISNAGGWALDFCIELAFADWLDVSPLCGLAPEYIDISAQTDTLLPGSYYDTLWFVDTLASNSPFGLPVHVEVDSVPPEIWLTETELAFAATRGQDNPPAQQFEIINTGGSDLKWSVEFNSAWLTVDPDTGTNQQTLTCTAEITELSSGGFIDALWITDPIASNSPQTITVSLIIDEPDTLVIPEVDAEPGQEVILPVILQNNESIKELSVPLAFDPTYLYLDSASFVGGRIIAWAQKSVISDSDAGTAVFTGSSPENPLPPGSGPIGHLFFHVASNAPNGTNMDVDTATVDLNSLGLTDSEGVAFVPHVVPGQVRISEQLAIFEEPQGQLIGSVELVNYPNPFNSATVIFIRGMASRQAHVVIYDVLGRPVRHLSNLIERRGSSGRVRWDGTDDSGQPLASGIYFGVLRTAQNRATQKILLLR